MYNLAALIGINVYARSLIKKKTKTMKKSELTIKNIVKIGSFYGCVMTGVYVVGVVISGYFLVPISIFHKHSEIQEALQSFTVRFDPYFIDIMLCIKMRAFGLSEGLIE